MVGLVEGAGFCCKGVGSNPTGNRFLFCLVICESTKHFLLIYTRAKGEQDNAMVGRVKAYVLFIKGVGSNPPTVIKQCFMLGNVFNF